MNLQFSKARNDRQLLLPDSAENAAKRNSLVAKAQSSEFYLSALLVLILGYMALANSDFFALNNLMSILNRLSYVLIAAVGMNLIIITSNIDVSAGALISVICLTIAAVGKTGAGLLVILPVAIVLGILLSLINALFITKLRIPAIVATLATSQLFAGILPLLFEGSIYDLPASFTWLGFDAKIGGIIPLSVLFMLIIVTIGILFMKYSRFSKKLYAVGNNKQAARYAGVQVDRTILIAYGIGGALFGISATIIATVSQRVTATMGSGLEMTFIACVVLGGTSISGGRGKLQGTVLGAIILTLISPAINYLGISSDWSDAIMGIIIIVSVVASELNDSGSKRTGKRLSDPALNQNISQQGGI
jgi:ribose/xylose/arabinose/galactoside ABC-type transport system permease subunit